MAKFKLKNPESIDVLRIDVGDNVVDIKYLTPELKTYAMQFLTVLFSFGSKTFIPCPKEQKAIDILQFMFIYTLFFKSEYKMNVRKHKHVSKLFEEYPDEFYIDFLTGKTTLKRVEISDPSLKAPLLVLFGSKKGDDSAEKYNAGVILNDIGEKFLSFGSSTLQFLDYNPKLTEPLKIQTTFKNNDFCVKLKNVDYEYEKILIKLEPKIRAIYGVLYYKRIFYDSWFETESFCEEVLKQYKLVIENDSPKIENARKKLHEWREKKIIIKKVKKIIFEKINPIILTLSTTQQYFAIRKIDLEKQGQYIIPIHWLTQ